MFKTQVEPQATGEWLFLPGFEHIMASFYGLQGNRMQIKRNAVDLRGL